MFEGFSTNCLFQGFSSMVASQMSSTIQHSEGSNLSLIKIAARRAIIRMPPRQDSRVGIHSSLGDAVCWQHRWPRSASLEAVIFAILQKPLHHIIQLVLIQCLD
ncbi:unnamed protein product, partial [Linum tenue]